MVGGGGGGAFLPAAADDDPEEYAGGPPPLAEDTELVLRPSVDPPLLAVATSLFLRIFSAS